MPRRAASRDRGHSPTASRDSALHINPPAALPEKPEHRVLQSDTLWLGDRLDLSAPQRGDAATMFLKKLEFVIPAKAGIQWSRH